MSVWEYKFISSGKGGFATPALMESFLNQLGKDEWEIIHFRTPADNALAFSGLARRSTQRDWTLEDAVAAAARAEAEKLRTEFEAKFRGAAGGGGAGPEDKPETLAAEKANADDGLRKLRDTDRDQEEGADDEPAEQAEPDEWQQLAKEEELPSFFEAIQPLMKRNQRGAGMSVGVDHLAKKWGMSEDDIMAALKECGFVIPEDEDDPPAYVEYDGDLFWVNVNRRGEIWVNTKEKPRPVFKSVKAERFTPDVKESGSAPASAEAADAGGFSAPEKQPESGGLPPGGVKEPSRPERAERPERPERPDRPERPGQDRRGDRGGDRPQGGNQPSKRGLPTGDELLARIKPLMRRARGGEGGSGSVGFLSRGLKCRDNELMAAFAAMGLTLAGPAGEPATEVVIGEALWWLNKDHRGGVWINARKPGSEKTASSEGSASGGPNAPVTSEEGGARPSASAEAAAEKPDALTEPVAEPPAGSSPAADGPSGRREYAAPVDLAPPSEPIAEAAAASEEAAIALSSEAPALPSEEQSFALAAEAVEPEASVAGEPSEPAQPSEQPEQSQPTVATAETSAAAESMPAEPVSPVPPLIARLRPLLKETRTGTLAGEIGLLAEATGQPSAALLSGLEALGLALPEKPREKPAMLNFGGEPVWLSKNSKDEFWFNAKPAREAVPERKPRRPKRPAADEPTAS